MDMKPVPDYWEEFPIAGLIDEGEYTGVITSFGEPKTSRAGNHLFLPVTLVVENRLVRSFIVNYPIAMEMILRVKEHFIGMQVRVRITHRLHDCTKWMDARIYWSKQP